MRKSGQNVQPRTGETHGLFGLRFLKYHNIRDPDWTAEDLVSQYEKLSNIYRKANRVDELQREQDEVKTVEKYNRMKEEVKELQAKLHVLLKGDVQRTKNVLQDHKHYQRMYKNKQSYDLCEDLEYQMFNKRKIRDACLNDKTQLIRKYEKDLDDAALKQEMIRYYDLKEFKQEEKTKTLLVELKNSETRSRAIEKENSVKKKILGQMLRDALFYEPVYEALTSDWKEQTMLVKQTYAIGLPAIRNVNKLKVNMKKLQKLSKKEETRQQMTFMRKNRILMEFPATVKQLVRRDSDFSMLGDRYERKTRSMMNLKLKLDDVESSLKTLKECTMSRKFEDVFEWIQIQPIINEKLKAQIDKRKQVRDGNLEKDEILKFISELLFDDLPHVYKEEKQREAKKLDKLVKAQQHKRKLNQEQRKKLGESMVKLRFGLHHIADVLRNLQSSNFRRLLEYPTVDLRLPLLKGNLPPTPEVIIDNDIKLLDNVTTLSNQLMANYQKEENAEALREANSQYQQAMIEESLSKPRPRTQKTIVAIG